MKDEQNYLTVDNSQCFYKLRVEDVGYRFKIEIEVNKNYEK